MGIGERQIESNDKALDEECSTPLRDKDPEKFKYPNQGICQKLRSSTVPPLYVIVGVSVTVIFILAALLCVRRGTAGTEVEKDPTCVQCRDGWVLYRGKCYFISDRPDTWKNSQDFCKSHHSSLAIIENENEMNFLNIQKSNNHWIGLSRAQDDTSWVWTNGTFYSESLFNIHRIPTAPGDSEHVFLTGEGFRSESGRYPKKWICSKSLLGETPKTGVEKDPTCVQCTEDWVLYRGKCYYFSDRSDTWKNSQDFCTSLNSSLAIIENEKEMNFLNLLKSNNYWIGLSRTQDNTAWVWTNGTFYSETLFNIHRKPTAPGESENVYLNGDGFKSESGRYPKKWICSKSLLGETPGTEVVEVPTSAQCTEDWALYRGKYYNISDQRNTWKNSQDFCESHNSSLAIIENEKEKNFLNLLKSNNYWIGLSRAQDNTAWVWTNGTFYSETLFNIQRMPTAPGDSENVYLNVEGFISESGIYPKKWICSKRFLGHPP